MKATDQINSTNLVPFRKRRGAYHIPGMTGENEQHALDVDHNLNREEERFIRHYLGYADTFLQHHKATERVEPKEEISAQKISLVKTSGNSQSSDAALNNDQLNADQAGTRENSPEAA